MAKRVRGWNKGKKADRLGGDRKKTGRKEDGQVRDAPEALRSNGSVSSSLKEASGKGKKNREDSIKRSSRKVSRKKNRTIESRLERQKRRKAEQAVKKKKRIAVMSTVGTIRNGRYQDIREYEQTAENMSRGEIQSLAFAGRKIPAEYRYWRESGILSVKRHGRDREKKEYAAKRKSIWKGEHKGKINSARKVGFREKERGIEKKGFSDKERDCKKEELTKKQDALNRKRSVDAEAEERIRQKEKQEAEERKKEVRRCKDRQHHVLQKHYAQEVREKETKKQITIIVAKKIQEAAKKHAALLVMIVCMIVLFIICFTLLGSCAMSVASMSGDLSANTYPSDPLEIDNTELQMQYLEAMLQNAIHRLETEYPGYDEYRQSGDPIGHDPFALISYFTAKYGIFTYADVYGEIQELFDLMYSTELTERSEGPFTTYIPVDDGSGNISYVPQEYYNTALTVEVEKTPLEEIIVSRLNEEQMLHYERLMEVRGGLQCFAAPVEGWHEDVSVDYGIYSSPVDLELHQTTGVIIHRSDGMEVSAMCSGIVTEAGYNDTLGNYLTVTNEGGYVATYGYLSSVSLAVGSEVRIGDGIAVTAGGDLYIGIMYGGIYYNPTFYIRF